MLRWLLTLLATLPVTTPLRADTDQPEKTQWIAVVAPGLRAAIEPLARHRQAGGFHVVVIDSGDVAPGDIETPERAAALRARVLQTWQAWKGPSVVLLVGAPVDRYVDEPPRHVLPALPGTAGRMQGRPSDNAYGCLDGEFLPRVAVGRFPARTAAEAEAMVRKTLTWERRSAPGAWKRRFVLLAGAPSYNPVIDRLIETLVMSRFGRLGPAWTGNVIYHNPNSHYALPVSRLHEQTQAYLKEGQLLTVFLGHSRADGFWFTEWGPPHFSADHWSELKLPATGGLLVTFGCYGAQFDGPGGEGYGLHAVRNPDGSVAVLGSQWSCHPAMIMLFSEGMLKNLPGLLDSPRLGELWLAMKAELANGPLDPLLFKALDAVTGDPNTPEAEQRREHLEMFLLLGDPALRLPRFGHRIVMHCPAEVRPGESFSVRAALPPALAGATGWVRLARALTSPPARIEPPSDELAPDERDRLVAANHKRANRFVLYEAPLTVKDGPLSVALRVPPQAPWDEVIVRVYLSTGATDAYGAQAIRVRAPP